MKEELSVDPVPKKNGLFIILLVLLSIKNVEAGIINLFITESVTSFRTNISSSTVLLLGFGSVLNLIFLYALGNWKKWGLLCYSFSAIIISITHFTIGFGINEGLFWIISLLVLFLVLNIGKEQKAWSYLK